MRRFSLSAFRSQPEATYDIKVDYSHTYEDSTYEDSPRRIKLIRNSAILASMNTSDQMWRKTVARLVPQFFTTDMTANMSLIRTPQHLLCAQENIPYVLWRWMHLEYPFFQSTTPSLFLESVRNAERWPGTGLFFPTAALSVTRQPINRQNAQVNITMNVDFIGFAEQPLIADVKHAHAGTPLQFSWGIGYTTMVTALSETLAPLLTRGLSDTELGFAVCQSALRHNLARWYRDRPYISHACTPDQWTSFWQTQLQAMNSENGLSTDTLLDAYTRMMRTAIPDFSLTTKELGQYKPKRGDIPHHKFLEQYDFWIAFGSYILVPLSMYLLLIEPVYIDKENFIDDMRMLLTNPMTEQLTFVGPCTSLLLTDFGQICIASMDEGMYKEFAV